MRASLLLVGVVVLAALAAPLDSLAANESYRLLVRAHDRAGARTVDVDVPWEVAKAGSPFDFTGSKGDDLSLERMRWAWLALQKVPAGRSVTIQSRSGSTRAWRRGGYLILEPHPRDRDDDHHSRIAIPEYIVTTILDNDGRLTARDVERLARARGRGSVTLVKVNSDEGGVTVSIARADGGGDAVD